MSDRKLNTCCFHLFIRIPHFLCNFRLFKPSPCYPDYLDGQELEEYSDYSVSQKKWSLVKCEYWGPSKPVCDIPYNLLHLHMIPGYVQALQEMKLCPYSLRYSPFKPYKMS